MFTVNYELKKYAVEVREAAENLHEKTSSELYQGKWSDKVAQTYADYARNSGYNAVKIENLCAETDKISRELQQADIVKDEAFAESLRATVEAL